jgi:O-antigen/teichoic acid export membrane protein
MKTPPLIARMTKRARRLGEESLLRNGLYIMGTTAVTSLLGFCFWIVAARELDPVDVGRAAALVSAMLFVGVFTNLGLGQVFISRLPLRARGREWSVTVTTGLLAAAFASLLGGVIAAAVLPVLIPSLGGSLGAAAFAVLPLGVMGVACSMVLDYAFIAERHAKPSFVRNAAAATLRLLLIGFAAIGPLSSAAGLLAIWVASFLLIDVFTLARSLPALHRGFRPTVTGWRAELAAMRRLIAGHQSINLGAQASTYLLPVIVSAQLGLTENAYFYATFMLATGVFFIAPAIANSLFAEGAHHPDHLERDVRVAARHIAMLAVPPALVLLVAGPWLLGLFGSEYADAGTGLLYTLLGAALFDAGYQLAIAVLRVRHQLRDAAIATWVVLALGIGFTWFLLPPLGLIGAGVGWGIGKVGGLVVALALVSRHRDAPDAPDAPQVLVEHAASPDA